MNALLEQVVLLQVEYLAVITSVVEVANIDILELHQWLVYMLTVVIPEFDLHLWRNLRVVTDKHFKIFFSNC